MFCQNCGEKIDENFLFCPSCGIKIEKKQIKKTKNEDKNENTTLTILVLIIPLILVIIIGICAITIKENNTKDNASVITQITKKEPTLKAEETLTGIKFTIYANDNYNQVDVTFTLLNEKGNIIKTETLSGFNYRKGNTYTLTSNLTIKEIFNAERYTYRISFYE